MCWVEREKPPARFANATGGVLCTRLRPKKSQGNTSFTQTNYPPGHPRMSPRVCVCVCGVGSYFMFKNARLGLGVAKRRPFSFRASGLRFCCLSISISVVWCVVRVGFLTCILRRLELDVGELRRPTCILAHNIQALGGVVSNELGGYWVSISGVHARTILRRRAKARLVSLSHNVQSFKNVGVSNGVNFGREHFLFGVRVATH